MPSRCFHDNGNEFLGPAFTSMLKSNNIKSVPTTVKKPQSIAAIERMHQTVNTILAISLRENPPDKFEDAAAIINKHCKAAQFAIRATMHLRMKLSPGEIAFGRNILHPFAVQVNWDELLKTKQDNIDKANIKENARRKYFDYKIGDNVLILNTTSNKGK